MQDQNAMHNEDPWAELKKLETEKDPSAILNDFEESSNETLMQENAEKQEAIEESSECTDSLAAQLDDTEIQRPQTDEVGVDSLKHLIRSEIKEEFDNQFAVLADQLESQFHTLSSKADSIIDKDSQLQEKDELFQKVYADLKKYQSGLDRVILSPFLKSAIKWYERVQELTRYYEAKTPLFGCGKDAYCDLLREFGNFGEYILDTLENFDIEIIRPEEGDVFDRSSSEAVSTVSTDNATMSGTVQKCFVAGFRYADGKVIQYAKVAVYKCDCGEA